MASTLRIATRKSPLALWQANHVRQTLESLHPDLAIEIVSMTTRGDKILDTPLAKVGGKGLFVKELEQAMLNGDADIAVHSMKDVPMEFPQGLCLGVICERENPRDAFVSRQFANFEELPLGARLGTSSLRRQSQLRALRPDLQVTDLRGNVNTRLKKLDDGEYDAIILATAGLMRLGFDADITAVLPVETCLPAGGQGALGIELRSDDAATRALIEPLGDPSTSACVTAERALNRHLQGGCQVPIACYAIEQGGQLWLRGLVGDPDGSLVFRAEARGSDATALGISVAEDLLAQGAGDVLSKVYGDQS